MAESGRVRLHITPFNAELLDRFIPTSMRPEATNISYHALETFPERGFGYVELPVMEAQKLKTKLNGSTLKGAKVKIEEAKPEKKRQGWEPNDDGDKRARKKTERPKRKYENGVLSGHELEQERHVKRGWSEDALKVKKSNKAAKEDKKDKKMIFRTEILPNRIQIGEEPQNKGKPIGKGKRQMSGKKAVVVKEFSKTAKPNTTDALRAQVAVSYEDGKGWVDEDGNVVEEEPQSRRRTRSSTNLSTLPEMASSSKLKSEALPTDFASEDKSSSANDESETATEVSSISEHEDAVDRQLSEARSNTATNAQAGRDCQNPAPVSEAVPSAEQSSPATSKAKEIHPLEALFKRRSSASNLDNTSPRAKRLKPINTSFSFFNPVESDAVATEGYTETSLVPQTPHTKQDLEWRSIRSAAPTPDTAAIGKRFELSVSRSNHASESDSGDDIGEAVHLRETGQTRPVQPQLHGEEDEAVESEFRKWFYDNRGDLNRAWKKRRREELKVGRQRENKRLSRRLA